MYHLEGIARLERWFGKGLTELSRVYYLFDSCDLRFASVA